MKIATCQLALQHETNTDDFWQRLAGLMERAAAAGSSAVLFPENFCLSLLPSMRGEGLSQKLQGFTTFIESFIDRGQHLAHAYNIHAIFGSVPFFRDDGQRSVARSYVFYPNGTYYWQEKINLNRYDKDDLNLTVGESVLNLFSVERVTCAVLVGYDVEFPRLASLAAHNGVQVFFVPSSSPSLATAKQVEYCSLARATETQSYVVHAPLRGRLEGKDFYGRPAVYSPCDTGFPDDGVVKIGGTDQVEDELVIADMSVKNIDHIRKQGIFQTLKDSKNQRLVVANHVGP